MEKVRIPRKSWVLVCDGAKALLLRNDGDAELLNLIPVHIYGEDGDLVPSAEDQPGRVYQSEGRARSSVEAANPRQQIEEAFLVTLAQSLDAPVREHSIEYLTIVAAPKALGVLREKMTAAVRATVRTEIAKDLTMLPIPEIERRLAG